MDKKFAHTIIQKTKEDYNRISSHFDLTRSEPWDEFDDFKEYLKKDAKILDLGCGNGRLVSFLNRITKVRPLLQRTDLCNKYVGMDISEKLIEIAKKKYSEFDFKVGDFSELPFDNDTFDIIFSIASFHHIPSEELRLEALEEMKRILKKNGIIIITVWNLWDQEKYQPFITANSKQQTVNSSFDIGDSLIPWKNKEGEVIAERYYHAFTEEELEDLFEKTELKVKKISKTKRNFLIILEK